MSDRSPKPTPRRRRSARARHRPDAAGVTEGRGRDAGQSIWDACVIWELGEGLALAVLGARGVA